MVLSISSFRMGVEEAAAPSGPFNQPNLNVIEGAGITLTVADNPGSSRVDVTIASAVSVKPTPTSWGFANETLTSHGGNNLVLTDSSPTVIYADPNGQIGYVTMPSEGSSNPFFFIVNRSVRIGESDEVIHISSAGGKPLFSLLPGAARWFITNGTTWLSLDAADLVERANVNNMVFTGSTVGAMLSGSRASNGIGGEFTITHAHYARGTAETATFELYKNGGATGSTIVTDTTVEVGVGYFSTPISYTTSDTLGLQKTVSGANEFSKVTVVADLGLAGLTYSGSLNADEYAWAGHTTGSATAGFRYYEHDIVIPFDCTYIGVSHSQGSSGGGREIEVWVNGGLSQAQNVNVSEGYLAFTETALSAGDTVAMYSDVGGSGDTHWRLHLRTPYTPYQFAGDLLAAGNALRYQTASQDSTSAATGVINEPATAQMMKSGRVAFMSWCLQNTGVDRVFRIEAGPADNNLGPTGDASKSIEFDLDGLGTQGYLDLRSQNFTIERGDSFAVYMPSGHNPSDQTTIVLWME